MSYKIAVYSICKNEEQFVDRWFNSIKTADAIFVLDTGSTDNTLSMLHEMRDINITNPKIDNIDLEFNIFAAYFEPFRFDQARNFILNQITATDYDYCLFIDMDEVLEDGWYDKLQTYLESCETLPSALDMWMVYSVLENGEADVFYERLAITKPGTWEWKYPVHEVLVSLSKEWEDVFQSGIKVYHQPDLEKSRVAYLPLLQTGVKEFPEDPRTHQYLAKEYIMLEEYDLAIASYTEQLKFETDGSQISETYRALGWIYDRQEKFNKAGAYYHRACITTPSLREPWGDFAFYHYQKQNWMDAIGLILQMFKCDDNHHNYRYIRNSGYYAEWPHRILADCYFQLGLKTDAQEEIRKAFKLAPNNHDVIREMLLICDIPVKHINSMDS